MSELESMKENPSLSTMWTEGTMINDEKSER
jgi:hypothetical protein